MCFGLESDGKIDQSWFDFKWAGQKQKIVGLLEVQTGAEVAERGETWRNSSMLIKTCFDAGFSAVNMSQF